MKKFLEAFALLVSSLVAALAESGQFSGLRTEPNYAFRERLAVLHPLRLAADAPALTADEVAVSSSWRIILADGCDDIAEHARADLVDYLDQSMGVRLDGKIGGAQPQIVLRVDPTLEKLQSRISVSGRHDVARIEISGVTSREVLQGCCRLEDEMNARGLPAVKEGVRTYTRLFSPRMTHSGWGLDQYPDVHLDQIAHAGMDAIVVFIRDPPDVTRAGREDIAALVERARIHGLDVYAYANFPEKSGKLHPSDPQARKWYDEIYGSVVRNAPNLKGLICVGESVAFPSKDAETSGFWWGDQSSATCRPGTRRNGFWPSSDWPQWLELVSAVTRAYNPDFDIVFWTYNWFNAPEKVRCELLERIPTNLTLHVTLEMGQRPVVKDGLRYDVEDYSITSPGPGSTFLSEAKVAGRRGIPLSSMANTGGRTWDFGALPFEPAPAHWLERFRSLRREHEIHGLRGIMETHHYGFMPNFIAEIAKAAFTREFDEKSLEGVLDAIAARDFGFANVDAVRKAWRAWDDAFEWHSPRAADQWGPLRLGPAYPLVMPGVKLPDPRFVEYSGIRRKTGWKYVWNSYGMPAEELAGRIRADEGEIEHLRRGNEILFGILERVPVDKRASALRHLGLGKYMWHSIRTQRNARRFKREGLVLQDRRMDAASKEEARKRLHAVLDDEAANVREAMPWVANDSSLGFEPSMRYVADPEALVWKLGQVEAQHAAVDAAYAPVCDGNRWGLSLDGKMIVWPVTQDRQLPHGDFIEMSGQESSLIVRYAADEKRHLSISRRVVWPGYRVQPNNTHASFSWTFDPTNSLALSANGTKCHESVTTVSYDGIWKSVSACNGLEITRQLFPSVTKPLAVEMVSVRNIGVSNVMVSASGVNWRTSALGCTGSYEVCADLMSETESNVAPGKSAAFVVGYSVHRADHAPVSFAAESERQDRVRRIGELTNACVLSSDDPVLDAMFRFAKIRAGESIFRTRGGLMHSPGGDSFYAATWCNDQVEYAGPWFAFTGDAMALDASLNAYLHYMPFMGNDYSPIPSSVIAEGYDYWNGAGDRGDAAMWAYGATRFVLAVGRRDWAERLRPGIRWTLEYCRRKLNGAGVVCSDSDELEGRFPSGKANLCTSSLYYDALVHASYLEHDLGDEVTSRAYAQRAGEVRKSIDRHFGTTLRGYETYRYFEGCDVLRSWIGVPLSMGMHERAAGTLDALFSKYLWTGCEMYTAEGDPRRITWDRSLLYAFRGGMSAGQGERVMKELLSYSKSRLLGDHVPFAVECRPLQRQLSAESALYCRIISEGLFAVDPVGLGRLEARGRLPKGARAMRLDNVRVSGRRFDMELSESGVKMRTVDPGKGD